MKHHEPSTLISKHTVFREEEMACICEKQIMIRFYSFIPNPKFTFLCTIIAVWRHLGYQDGHQTVTCIHDIKSSLQGSLCRVWLVSHLHWEDSYTLPSEISPIKIWGFVSTKYLGVQWSGYARIHIQIKDRFFSPCTAYHEEASIIFERKLLFGS